MYTLYRNDSLLVYRKCTGIQEMYRYTGFIHVYRYCTVIQELYMYTGIVQGYSYTGIVHVLNRKCTSIGFETEGIHIN